jgi:hypothetical protein
MGDCPPLKRFYRSLFGLISTQSQPTWANGQW